MASGTIRTDRTVSFDAPPDVVWSRLEAVGDYQGWWPWLKRFEADELADGERWTCTVQPPLPYTVSFTLDLFDVVPGASVSARVAGDISGDARIELRPAGGWNGTELALTADLVPASGFLRRLTRLAGPVARYGHDQVVDRAMAQFAARAL